MERIIKVLHVGLSDNVGGIETVVRSWYRYLPDDIIFDFINNNTGNLAFEEDFISSGSKIYKIPSRKSDYKGSYDALTKIVEAGGYDYLHFHAMSFSWPEPIIIANKIRKTQPIVHSHLVVDKNMSLKYLLLHAIGKLRLSNIKYNKLACGTEAGKSMFGNQKFVVVPNGIELERFYYSKEKREKIRNLLGVDDGVFIVGHVGRSGRQKNYPFIFKTVRDLIISGMANIKLLLLGNVKNNPEIKQLEIEYGLSPYIIYAGYVKDVSSYYSAMDCFFFPSLYEGFSVSLVEAQTANLPCVVSENVAKESKLINYFDFVGIQNTLEASEAIKKYSRITFDRSVKPEIQFDIKKTSNQLFEYYRSHIITC